MPHDLTVGDPGPGLSICVLAVAEGPVLREQLSSLLPLGHVVVGVVEAGTVDVPGATLVSVAHCTSSGAAWQELLRAAPTDRCLLVRPGEVLVAGDPSVEPVFTSSTVIEVPDPLAVPDRLPSTRLVDRRRCRMVGTFAPRLLIGDGTSGLERANGVVLVDTGVRHGTGYRAWLHRVGAFLDDTTDREEHLALAEMLAATGEYDAAIARLVDVVGAGHDDVDLRVARLLALVGLRRRRYVEASIGSARWRELTACPGPAAAVTGLILAQSRRHHAAEQWLAEALETDLTDGDGYTVDRSWVEAIHARIVAELPAERVQVLRHVGAVEAVSRAVAEAWDRCGFPLADLISAFEGVHRATAIESCLSWDLGSNTASTSALAEWFAAVGAWREVARLVEALAAEGLLTMPQALAWSRRRVAAWWGDSGPLERWAASGRAPVVGRVLAAAHLSTEEDGSKGRQLLREVAPLVHPCILAVVARRLAREVPGSVGVFVEAAGTSTDRRRLLEEAAVTVREAA